MAKTYKKKQDNFVRNIFIGFGVAFFVLMAVFVYMRVTEPKYTDFESIPAYEFADNMPEDAYAVYFYSESCPACNSIKSGFLRFAKTNELGLKVYMMDAGQTDGSYTEIPNLSATPTLLIYQDGEIVDFIQSATSIQEFMGEVEDGTYDVLD